MVPMLHQVSSLIKWLCSEMVLSAVAVLSLPTTGSSLLLIVPRERKLLPICILHDGNNATCVDSVIG